MVPVNDETAGNLPETMREIEQNPTLKGALNGVTTGSKSLSQPMPRRQTPWPCHRNVRAPIRTRPRVKGIGERFLGKAVQQGVQAAQNELA